MKKLSFILLSFILFPAAYAQKVWTLNECVEQAMKGNIKIKQQQLLTRIAEADKLQSKLGVLPTLNGNVQENFSFGRNVDPVTNAYINNNTASTSMGLSASVVLFSGLQQYYNIKQAQTNLNATQFDFETLKNDISLFVITSYLQVMYNEDALNNANSQFKTTQDQLDRTQKLVDAGKFPESNVIELKAQLANEELNVINAKNALDISKLTLLQLMEMPYDEKFKVQYFNIEMPALADDRPVAKVYNSALETRPEIKSAQLRTESAVYGIKYARGGMYPRLTAGAGFSTLFSDKIKRINGYTLTGVNPIGFTHTDTVFAPYYTPIIESVGFQNQLKDNFGRYLGVTLTIPIYNGWRVQTQIQKSKISAANSQLSLDQTKSQLFKNIQQAVADLNAAKARYGAAQKNYSAQKLNYENVEKRYANGIVNYVDFSTSKNNYARAESTLTQAKYDLIFRSKIIDLYLGIPIKL